MAVSKTRTVKDLRTIEGRGLTWLLYRLGFRILFSFLSNSLNILTDLD